MKASSIILILFSFFNNKFVSSKEPNSTIYNNILLKDIWNPIIYSDRINYVLFALDAEASYEDFNNLLNGFKIYENLWNNESLPNKPDSCNTFVSFGGEKNMSTNDLSNYGNYGSGDFRELYNNSLVSNVTFFALNFLESESLCPQGTVKESWIIVTNLCLTFFSSFNQTIDSNCSMFHRSYALIIPSLKNCSIHTSSKNLQVYPVDTKTPEDFQSYINMSAGYTSNTKSSVINLFAIISQENLHVVRDYINDQLLKPKSDCSGGTFIGYFSVSGTHTVVTSVFTLPLYFNEKNNTNWFNLNFKQLLSIPNQDISETDRCETVNNFLETIMSSPEDLNQFNIVILDSYPPCVGQNLHWNLTKHHLEVIIFNPVSSDKSSDYYNILTNDSHKSNHIIYYNPTKNYKITDLTTYNTVCLSNVSTTTFAYKTASSTSPSNAPVKWWIIGSVVIFLLAFGIAFVVRGYARWKIEKRREKLQTTIQAKLELSPLESHLSHDKRIAMQINSKNVIVDFANVLGKGSNATVYKAFVKGESSLHSNLKRIETSQYIDCDAAIKIPTTFDHDEVEEFVRELDALIMVGHHPHIIALLGWTLHRETPCLVTELAESDLLSYVRSLRNTEFPHKIFLSILWQISQALEFIASFSMVHRDIACRNILLTETKTAKLADFGLCCHCDESFTYRASLQKRLPLKWLSIEALIDRLFSEKSDVWSFGVLCWEMYSYGAVPYPAQTHIEMLDFLKAGHRLEKSVKIPDEMYEIMLDCWKEQPAERPTFKELGQTLRQILEQETVTYGYLTLEEKDAVNLEEVDV